MTSGNMTVQSILDEMALKIMMIEPGNLIVVGEMLELVDKLLDSGIEDEFPPVYNMAVSFKVVIEKIIMTDLPDTAASYENLGKCITQMQELERKRENDENAINEFCRHMKDVGQRVEADEIIHPPKADAKQKKAPVTKKKKTAPEPAKAEGGAGNDFLQDKELLGGFIEEAFEHLENIEVGILDLEQHPDDLDIINNIFRPFHTIKGVAGFLNLKKINQLAHTAENLLDDVRNGKRSMDSEVIDVVLNVGDFLRTMVQNIKDVLEKGPGYYKDYDISEYVEIVLRLQEEGRDAPAAVEPAPEPQPVAEKVSPEPAPEPEKTQAGPEEFKGEEDETEIAEEEEEQISIRPEPKKVAGRQREDTPARQQAGGTGQKKRLGASIKVDIEKLDSLVNAVGELVIMQAMVQQNPKVVRIADPKLSKDFSQLSRITTELQKTAMAMRMVPIRQTFQKMIRLVRDLSRKAGKKVDLVMHGEETEIDRNMVDSIYDPLVHMIRNSVDHGVPKPE